VKEVVEGADAVLSGIGTVDRHDPRKPASSSARAAVEAMVATGVRRIIVVSARPHSTALERGSHCSCAGCSRRCCGRSLRRSTSTWS
jgi:hypothetical protein